MARERRSIVAVMVFAVVLAIVARVGFDLGRGSTFAFDEWLLISLRQGADLSRPIGPYWLKQSFIDITAVGGARQC